eukprot:358237-Chlamydomonas_euryale.AAC.4
MQARAWGVMSGVGGLKCEGDPHNAQRAGQPATGTGARRPMEASVGTLDARPVRSAVKWLPGDEVLSTA